MSDGKKKLGAIKSGALSRGFALAKLSVSAGGRAASHAVGNLFAADEDKPERLKAMFLSQMTELSRELGQLKGSLMKVGQMLSMYGENLFPPEVNAVLKTLQSQSPPLEYAAIEKVLKRQLGPEKLSLLEIEREATASASLGQVHAARRISDGAKLALKIQYPGVDQAIESDLKTLRSVLSMSRLIPGGPKYDQLFDEVRQMLHQEVDYEKELRATDEFRSLLKDDPRYIIPEPMPEFCSRRVFTTRFEGGLAVDSAEVAALSQERRNAIGAAALDLYFRELFVWGAMQTDPHFGNYRVRLGEAGAPDRLVLYDFGAVRRLSKTFLSSYRQMVVGAFRRDAALLEKGALGVDFLREDDSEERRQAFRELCYLITEPFHVENFNWAENDLPMRVAKKGAEFALSFKLRPPPREVVFLDRKMSGVFVFLSVLKVRFRVSEILENYIN